MYCPQCNATVVNTVTHCPYCGAEIHVTHRYISFGKISLIFALISIGCVVFLLALLRFLQTAAFGFALFFTNILMLLAVLSIIFGSVAFVRKTRDVFGLIGLVLGFYLLIGLAIGISLAMSIRF